MSSAECIPYLTVVVLLPLMLVLIALGERVARRINHTGTGPIDAAILALLGLLIGFQFAGAASRLDARRTIVVKEANAIGTAYLRVDLLPAEDQPALRELFRTYTTLRIRMAESSQIELMVAADTESRKVQTQIWTRAVAACKKAPSPATQTLVIAAINDMIDVTTERYVAAHTHTPVAVVVLLFGVTTVCAFLVGYSTINVPFAWVMRGLFATVIVGTMFVTLDMEFPRIGFIRIGAADDVMTDTRRGMD